MADDLLPLPPPSVSRSPFLDRLGIPEAVARLEQAPAVPGMLTIEERAMLTRVVATTWRGEGAIIDGGSFLGSSLVAEAQGLQANPAGGAADWSRFPGGKPIHGYERGIHPGRRGPRERQRKVYDGFELDLGDDFVSALERATEPYRDAIALHIGDLNDQHWDGSPIEIAFIDVCKTARLNAHVSREFLTALVPGASTLIHQDFFFDRLPWIRVTMGHLADHFRWEGQVNSSSVYTNVSAVPADVASYDPFLHGTFDDCLRLHDAVPFPGIGRGTELRLALSRGLLMAHKGRRSDALDYLGSLAVEYSDVLTDPATGPDARRRLDRCVGQVTSGVLYRKLGWDGVDDTVDGRPTVLPLLGETAAGTTALREVDLAAASARVRERPTVPGQTSVTEQALLEELAAKTWRGEGAIVDVGSFLGASLVAEAEGLRANPVFSAAEHRVPGLPIHGFDRGFLPAPPGPAAKRERTFGDVTIQLGDSFLPRLTRTVAPYGDLVKLHVGDLEKQGWDGSPIELAFVDAAPSATVNARIAASFFPALIAGSSTLVVRDVYSDRLPWVNVTVGFLAGHLRWQGQVRMSAVYGSTTAVPADVATYDPFTEATLDECLRYHDASGGEVETIGREWQLLLALSRVRLVAAKGDPDGAVDLLRDTADRYVDLLADGSVHLPRIERVKQAISRPRPAG
ncbi:hypothetical protein SFC88_06750 [Nocardioides sp. HM23]|uniref:hypothetical protein n=1 Tax=Nocardioides bizhenqiangii TaxID=3095076 RepID=UPI002ACA831E|nr:hypothetical protein [Nocardioides sp. HM23]MDZ5620514.1 hypothetical protein [Nocardioides sp. HM23]